jgi:non-heme chloroperoxidase
MDHYADDLAALTAYLDLHDAVHLGHSTGGGEVVRYIASMGKVASRKQCSSVRPIDGHISGEGRTRNSNGIMST